MRHKSNIPSFQHSYPVRRYARLFWLFVKIGLMKQMAYRPQFILMVFGKIIRIALIFFFFQAIFLRIDRLGHWEFEHILLIFVTFHIIDFIISITFFWNLAFRLPNQIRTGELDFKMIKPVSLLFIVSLENINLMDFFSFLPSLAFLAYVLYELKFSLSIAGLTLYFLLIMNALIFLFAVILIIATISFWTTQSIGLARIFDNMLKISRYPLDIFHGFWKIVLVYFLPLVIVAQIPSKALLGITSPLAILGSCCAAITFLFMALTFWKRGLENYLSASS